MQLQQAPHLPPLEMQVGMEVRQEKARVLVVDDEPGFCTLLNFVLSREGFHCETCLSGEEALEAMEREPFDAVLTDLRMPGISGLELLKTGREKYPHAAFLVATADYDVRNSIQAMKQGVADYLLKPLEVESVAEIVERAVQVKRIEAALEKRRRDLERILEERNKELDWAKERVERAHDEMMEILGAALDARDDETSGHALRVTRYALEIARKLGCSAEQLDGIVQGSFLHDIGKIGIPDAVLLKPGELTPKERAIMQAHVEIGYNLIKRADFMAPAAEIVLTHHERYNGMGYPRGLKCEEIPLGGRIFAVADTLDAMTSDRPYRRALPFRAARDEIIFQSARQFDPAVVRAFLAIPEDVWIGIRQEVEDHRSQQQVEVPKLSLVWQRWGNRAAG